MMPRGVYERTNEMRANMSVAHKGKNLSDETKDKISAALIGRKLSVETKAKMSVANTGKKLSVKTKTRMSIAQKGKKKTVKHRANISAAMTGKKHTDERRANNSVTQKIAHARPEVKANHAAAHARPEVKARQSASAKIANARPEVKAKQSAAAVKRILKGNDTTGYGKHGHFCSWKNGNVLYYRSLLECDWYEVFDNPKVEVEKFEVEPFFLPYKFEEYTHKYTPDIKAYYSDGSVTIFEMKPEFQWDEPMNLAKFKAARAYCKKRGWRFDVLGYEELKEWQDRFTDIYHVQ